MRIDQFGGNSRRLRARLDYKKHNGDYGRCCRQSTEGWRKKPFSPRGFQGSACPARGLLDLLTNPITHFGRDLLIYVALLNSCVKRLDACVSGLAFRTALQMALE